VHRPVLTTLLASALAAAGLVAAAPPASATGSCGASPSTSGVAVESVGPLERDDWWHYESLVGVHVVTLTAAPVDADLYVYDGSCSALLCSATSGALTPDVCVVTTPTLVLNIRVEIHGSPFDTEYVLTVV
jgi:hypothetical protein